uniref:Putative endonuclease n=1 Tax=mine drainage metagenome TaxID=410659 RepID=E6QBJ3_9ZZZZ
MAADATSEEKTIVAKATIYLNRMGIPP